MRGIIFDMDGVLFDTEKLYGRFWVEAAGQMRYRMKDEDVAAIRSTDAVLAKKILKERLGDDFDYEAVKKLRIRLMEDYVDAEGIEVMDGIREVLEYARFHGFKIALASTSPLNRARQFLRMGGIDSYFDYLMTGDQVTHGKPHPEIYEKAACGIHLLPQQCFAVEDSYNGVRSAYAAGCRVLMVPDRDVPDDEMKEKAYRIVSKANEIIEIMKEI